METLLTEAVSDSDVLPRAIAQTKGRHTDDAAKRRSKIRSKTRMIFIIDANSVALWKELSIITYGDAVKGGCDSRNIESLTVAR